MITAYPFIWSMTLIITVVVALATATVIVAIRRAITQARKAHTPEYWRMYARACAARCERSRAPDRVPADE